MSQVTEVGVGWGGGNNDFLNIYNVLKVLVFHHNELYFSVAPKAITGLLNANEVVNASQSYLLLRIPPDSSKARKHWSGRSELRPFSGKDKKQRKYSFIF